jgi:hypothetical protein
MNTGGKTYDESQGVVAHTGIHHSKQYHKEADEKRDQRRIGQSLKITVVKK